MRSRTLTDIASSQQAGAVGQPAPAASTGTSPSVTGPPVPSCPARQRQSNCVTRRSPHLHVAPIELECDTVQIESSLRLLSSGCQGFFEVGFDGEGVAALVPARIVVAGS